MVSEAPAAIGDASEVVARAVATAAPELSRSGHDSVTLRARDTADVIESFLTELTRELRRLCAPYDYRQLFLFSRLCINLPVFRSAEHNLHRVGMRVQTADLCAVGFGSRLLSDFVRIDDGGYSLGRPPDTMARDVVKLHELARRYRLARRARAH